MQGPGVPHWAHTGRRASRYRHISSCCISVVNQTTRETEDVPRAQSRITLDCPSRPRISFAQIFQRLPIVTRLLAPGRVIGSADAPLMLTEHAVGVIGDARRGRLRIVWTACGPDVHASAILKNNLSFGPCLHTPSSPRPRLQHRRGPHRGSRERCSSGRRTTERRRIWRRASRNGNGTDGVFARAFTGWWKGLNTPFSSC